MSEDPEFAVVTAVERRAEITASIQAETGIDEAMIQRLVRGFYARVREDPLTGPVFAARILDWEPYVRFLVICDADDRALPRSANAEAFNPFGGRAALR
jgi:hypothetical protein